MMAFLDNLKTLQEISSRCDQNIERLTQAKNSVALALGDSNLILQSYAGKIQVLETDISIDLASGDTGRQGLAAISSSALQAARAKVLETISRLQVAKQATENL